MSSGVAQKWLTPLREIPTGHVWMGKRWGGVLCCWLSPIWLIIVASFFERPPYRMMPFYDDQTLTGKALVVCLPIAISYYFGLKYSTFNSRRCNFFFSKRLEKLTCAWIRCTSVPVETTHHTVEFFYFLGGKQISSIYFSLVFLLFLTDKKMVVRDSIWLTTTTILLYPDVLIFFLSPLTLVLVCTK